MSIAKKEAENGSSEPAGSATEFVQKDHRVERLETFSERVHGDLRTAPSEVEQSTSVTQVAETASYDTEAPAPVTRVDRDSIKLSKDRTNASALRFALRMSDIAWVACVIIAMVWNAYIGTNNRGVLAAFGASALGTIMFAGTLILSNAHQFHPTENYRAHMKKVFFAAFSALGLWLATALIIRPNSFEPNGLAFAGGLAVIALFLLHSLYYIQVRRMHDKRALSPHIVMLGATESARRIIEENARTRDLNIVAIFDDRLSRAPAHIHGVPVVGRVQDLLGWSELPYVDRIVVTLPSLAQGRRQEFVEQIRRLPNRIAFVVDEFETLDHVKQRVSQIAQIGLQDLTGKPKSGRHTAVKRVMDITISSVALLLGAPFLALIALMIKVDSPGPVIFKQKRHGFNNREFEVYKFRSLYVEQQDKDAAQQVQAGDSRVTRIGRIIRKTSIDELPQLLNVLKGDMSLVGPRPHAVGMRTGNVESYKLVEEYAHRHAVKPGMTGWAQINGSRGPLHDAAGVSRRVQLDIEYIERASAWFDLMIMIKTLPCLLGDSENIR